MSEAVCYIATGRRKTATASARLFDGKGLILVNKRPFENYFPIESVRDTITAPLTVTGTRKDYDIDLKISGGGLMGQAGASLMAIARALSQIDQTHHDELRRRGMLTRDDRMVERKKHGCHKARRGKQFSKR